MKHKNWVKYIPAIISLLFTITTTNIFAGDLANDTVWTKETDQLQGFSSVQFIKNDQIIVGQSPRDWNLFYDASNGNEIKRIQGLHKPLFLIMIISL